MFGDSHIPVHSCWSPVGESGNILYDIQTLVPIKHVIMLYIQLEIFFFYDLTFTWYLEVNTKVLGWWMKHCSGQLDIHGMEIASGLSWYIQQVSTHCMNITLYMKMYVVLSLNIT